MADVPSLNETLRFLLAFATDFGLIDPLAQQRARGAYGFAVAGISGADELLVKAPAHWPLVHLSLRTSAEGARPAEAVDANAATIHLSAGGWAHIEHTDRRAVFWMPSKPSPEAVVHPHLAAVAVALAHWAGQQSFHAGAFIAQSGAWGVLGNKEAGKSSVLASLALAGVPVLADDVLVLSGLTAFAGPRSVDLRSGAAGQLKAGVSLGLIGERERWRVPLAPVEAEVPFRGWVQLRWGSRLCVRRTRGSERLRVLLPHRALRVTPDRPGDLMHLAALPVLELSRPREWSSHEDAIAALLGAIAEMSSSRSGPGQPGGLEQGE